MVLDYEIRSVMEGDLPFLSRNLRSADTVELMATYGRPIFLEALERSVSSSEEVKVITGHSGNPMFVFGRGPRTKDIGFVWACGTPEIAQRAYHVPFLKASRQVIKQWFEDTSHKYFINLVHANNTVHHKWLRWCQAELLPAAPYGPLGHEFHPFIIRKTSYV